MLDQASGKVIAEYLGKTRNRGQRISLIERAALALTNSTCINLRCRIVCLPGWPLDQWLRREPPRTSMPSFRFAFENCRRELSLPARSSLDRLAARLATLKPHGRDVLTPWTKVIGRSAPGLTNEECRALAVYALCALAAASRGDGSRELIAATPDMQETEMSFNLQYLQLQNMLQDESRAFTAISNIMKTKHGTVKNSISNIH